jgi:hypothetical protein
MMNLCNQPHVINIDGREDLPNHPESQRDKKMESSFRFSVRSPRNDQGEDRGYEVGWSSEQKTNV